MKIHSITLCNFGLYRGEVRFDLAPSNNGIYSKPVVVISGKNGVGKSTLLEGLRVCLHGPLALGHRVARADYQRYIFSHLHRSKTEQQPASEAFVQVEFDYVRMARRARYDVKRYWRRNGEKAEEELLILENGQPLPEGLNSEQAEIFLRELLPPRVADLFFFDGERFEVLAEETGSAGLLAETVNGLLGLHLVEQLRKDLDVFISRQTSNGNDFGESLESIDEQLSANATQVSDINEQQRLLARDTGQLQDIITQLEARLAREGKTYAEKRGALRQERQQLEQAIQLQRRTIQELCSGLMPFSISPKYCQAVEQRLLLEAANRRQTILAVEIKQHMAALSESVLAAEFWRELERRHRRRIYRGIIESVQEAYSPPPIKDDVLPVSEPERQALLQTTRQVLTETPRQFVLATRHLKELETRLEAVKREQDKIPPEASLQPLLTELREHNRRFGELQKTQRDLIDQRQHLAYEAKVLEQRRRAAQLVASEQNKQSQKVQLAVRAQATLTAYAERLTQAKLHALETKLTEHFNQLCRKARYIEVAHFDPSDYSLTLYRDGHPFLRERLSAGERQLLAVALMWALHEVSGLPLPVIIDTPLARLDSDHRRSLVNHYFPHGSHQMILLGTDLEIDQQVVHDLAHVVTRWYHLSYDATANAVAVEERLFQPTQEALPL